MKEHRRETRIGSEAAMHAVRQRRGWALGSVRWLPGAGRDTLPLAAAMTPTAADIPALTAACNDQGPVGRWPLIRGPLWYLKLKLTCGLGRTTYS